MNKILLSTIRCVGVVSMSLACTVPALAQSSTGSSGSGTSAGNSSTTNDTRSEERRDYGWIGLLGLAGLLGLRKKSEDRTDIQRTTDTSR